MPSMTAAIFAWRCPSSSSTPLTRRRPTSRRRSTSIAEGLRRGRGLHHPARRDRHRQDLHDGRRRSSASSARRWSSPTTRRWPRSSATSSASSSPTTRSSTSSATTTTTSPRPTSRTRTSTSRRTRSINDEIDRLRHAATASLLARRDVVIVASVSCIFGIGSPELYRRQMQLFKVGEWIDRDELFRKLVGMQYTRNETALTRGTFRAAGEMLEIFPAYAESAYRINLFGDEIESIHHFDPLTGEIFDVDRPRRGLAGEPLRDRGGDARARRARDQGRARRAPGLVSRARQGARGAPAAAAHPVRHRDAQGARLHLRDRELLADLRQPRAGLAAAHADRLLPRRLRHLRRRVAPDDPADRRHVRGRPLAQADAGRLRLPAAVGDGQPAAQVRRVPAPRRPAGDGLGDAGRVRAHDVEADRRADRAPDRDRRPRDRGARDPQPDRRPDERGPRAGPSARSARWSRP